jgi:hypothetical protein
MKLSKTPSVTIRNLKILPFFTPLPRPDSTSMKSEEESSKLSLKSKKYEKKTELEKEEGKAENKERTSRKVGRPAKRSHKPTSDTKMSETMAQSKKVEVVGVQEQKSDLEQMLEGMRDTKKERPKKGFPVASKTPVKTTKPQETPLSVKTAKPIQDGRRSSLSKREQWVVTPRVKTPSPTPMPFVAKKSRPDETVSFSLPAGGFKNDAVPPKKADTKAAKPLPWFAKVDDLFSQYYPDVDKNRQARTSIESESDIDVDPIEENILEPTSEVESSFLVGEILEDILESALNVPTSRPTRSRGSSGDSSRSEASSGSSSERPKHQKLRRRTEDLGK